MQDLLNSVTQEQLARSSFLYYLKHVEGLYPFKHIQQMVDEIEKPCRYSIIVVPPGHGKSTILSQTYPSWYLGNYPQRSILLISSTDKQAKTFFHANQHTMEHRPEWAKVFPYTQPDLTRGWSVDGLYLRWLEDEGWKSKPATNKDPALSAFGIGGPVIGRRADLIIVDDPYSEEVARSAAQRANFLTWFRRTLLSRLKPLPHAKLVMALTRWDVDDVVAWAEEINRLEAEGQLLEMPTSFDEASSLPLQDSPQQ